VARNESHDPTDLIGNAEREEEATRLRQIAEKQARDDLIAVMSTDQGRRVVRRIIEHCGVYKTSMTGNSYTFFNEGKRDVGLFLTAKIADATPQHLAEMLLSPN